MQNWCLADTILLIVLILNGLAGAILFVRDCFCDRLPDEQDLAGMEEMLNQYRKELEERENQKHQPKT